MFYPQVIGMAALSCGMISVGSCNGEVTSTILQTMMERSEADLKDTYSRYLALGLALAYLGKIHTVVIWLT
jgi:26S proteasome regulatory subunit N1